MEVSSEPKTITIKIPDSRTIITTILVAIFLIGGGYFFIQNQALTIDKQKIGSHVEALEAINNVFFGDHSMRLRSSLENVDAKIAALEDTAISNQWEKAKQGISFEGEEMTGWSPDNVRGTTTLITSRIRALLGVPPGEIFDSTGSSPPPEGESPPTLSLVEFCAQEGGQWDGSICQFSGVPPGGAPCPAPPVECPVGYKKEAIFNSTECGTYYSCVP